MNKKIICFGLILGVLFLSGCFEEEVEYPAPQIDAETMVVDNEIRAEIEFDFIDMEEVFEAYFIVLEDELDENPEAENTVVVFKNNESDLFVIRASAEDVQNYLFYENDEFFQKMDLQILVPEKDLLESKLLNLELKDIAIAENNNSITIAYTLKPFMADTGMHLSILKTVLIETGQLFPLSKKIILNEKIEWILEDLTPVDADFSRIETATENALNLASGEITDVKFMENVAVTSLFE